ncbi:MAG: NAD-dependent epimerase/dehydratase family protein [Acidimicrobiia bacterium]
MTVTDAPVLITGVTGYIGAEVAKQLLAAGYRVRGTTRDADHARVGGYVTGLDGAAERLELVQADLLDAGSIATAATGCDYIIHVASPYILDVADPQRDLVDPAVKGTEAVLEAASLVGTVKRVVLTSSVAAVMGAPRARVFTETDWNTVSTLDNGPYSFSKTQAERLAWDYVESEQPSFDLVVINPSGVIGPSIVPRLNQSAVLFSNLTNGETPGIVSLDFAYVDVRDVGKAHVAAMETPSASGRYICSAETVTMRRVIDVMREMGLDQKYKLPSMSLDNAFGNLVVRLVANAQPKGTRSWLKTFVGKTYTFDTARIESELSIEFRDMNDTLSAAIADTDHWGHLGHKVVPGEEVSQG